MSRYLFVMSAMAFVVTVIGVPSDSARACMIISAEPVVVEGEESLIVWDAQNRREYFIRRADFRGARRHFGFVVPTPTRPTLSDVDDALFDRLAQLYTRPSNLRSGRGIGGEGRPGAVPATVTIVERTRVAGLDATVLLANEAQALTGWLRQNGYTAPPGMAGYLRSYIERGWYVTAFRYDPAGARNFGSRAVMMAFSTDQPFFPYAEPRNARRARGRTFRVTVVSATRITARVGDQPWTARVGFADRTGAVHGILPHEIPPRILPDRAWITTFDERNSVRGRGDLFFDASNDTTPIPSTIETHVAHGRSRARRVE